MVSLTIARKVLHTHRRRQIGVQDCEFAFLLLGQLGAAAFFEAFNRVLALLHLFTDNLCCLGVVELTCRGGLLDRRVFERGFQHTQDAEFGRIFGAHRIFQIGVDSLGERHGQPENSNSLGDGQLAGRHFVPGLRGNLRTGRTDLDPTGLVKEPDAPVKLYKNRAAGSKAMHREQDLSTKGVALIAANAGDRARRTINQVELATAARKQVRRRRKPPKVS